ARVAGETAPLLFTAFSNRYWSEGWLQPTASLPVMIFTYAIAPYDDWHRQAWAAALVLLTLVLGANVFARLVLRRGTALGRASGARPGSGSRADSHGFLPRHHPRARFAGQDRRPQSQRLLRRHPGAQLGVPRHPGGPGDGAHRPVGVRQVDLPAVPQPHERP